MYKRKFNVTKAITTYTGMTAKTDEHENALTKLSLQYRDTFVLRAAIQGIPVLGGSPDTILGGLGSKWQARRLESYVRMLEERLARLEVIMGKITIDPTEELYDFIMQTFDFAIKTRSDEKRQMIANIVTNQVIKNENWDEAESASRLLNDLSELHVHVLLTALGPNMKAQREEGSRLITFSDRFPDEAINLRQLFSGVSVVGLRMICSELLAKGLLQDEGLTRAGVGSMVFLEPTDLAEWFIKWIREPNY
jgi:hypothetical protein